MLVTGFFPSGGAGGFFFRRFELAVRIVRAFQPSWQITLSFPIPLAGRGRDRRRSQLEPTALSGASLSKRRRVEALRVLCRKACLFFSGEYAQF